MLYIRSGLFLELLNGVVALTVVKFYLGFRTFDG